MSVAVPNESVGTGVLSNWEREIMSFRALVTSVVAALALLAGPSAAGPLTPMRADNPIDVEAYCNYNHDVGSELFDSGDAFSWRCEGNIDVSMDLACRQQYGEEWASAYEDRYDAYSWYCYQQGD